MKCLAFDGRWIISGKEMQLDPPEIKYLNIKNISLTFFNPDAMGIYGLNKGKIMHCFTEVITKLTSKKIKIGNIKEYERDEMEKYIKNYPKLHGFSLLKLQY